MKIIQNPITNSKGSLLFLQKETEIQDFFMTIASVMCKYLPLDEKYLLQTNIKLIYKKKLLPS